MPFLTLTMRPLDIWLPVLLSAIAAAVLVTAARRRALGLLRGGALMGGLVLVGLWAAAVWLVRPMGFGEPVSAMLYILGALVLGALVGGVTPRVPEGHGPAWPREPGHEAVLSMSRAFWLLFLLLGVLWILGMLAR